jgi:hypothetical protein
MLFVLRGLQILEDSMGLEKHTFDKCSPFMLIGPDKKEAQDGMER